MKNIAIITGASSGIGKEFLLNMPKNIDCLLYTSDAADE